MPWQEMLKNNNGYHHSGSTQIGETEREINKNAIIQHTEIIEMEPFTTLQDDNEKMNKNVMLKQG
ncbi:11039_t:CDS:2, partial [Entrophospora sp. SA101]